MTFKTEIGTAVKTKPAVTVITRTKDRVLLLDRAVRSVLNQEFTNWRHVIVNDGGDSEEVERLLAKYQNQYDGRLKIVHNDESLTMESASNAGLALSNSEYFCIHDDDDSWEPTFLKEMVGCLDSHGQDKNVGGVICFANVIMEDIVEGKVVEKNRHFFSDYNGLSFFSMMGRNWFPPICFLIRTAVLEKIGPFDGTLPVLGDWDFNMRFMQHYDLVIYRRPLANYHHRDTATGAFSNSVYADNDKHRYYRNVLLDRQIKVGLQAGTIDTAQLAIFGMLNQRITDLQDEIKKMKSDLVWELKAHITWAAGKN